MKKLRKRVISLLLACVMAFSLLPMNAWAYAGELDISGFGIPYPLPDETLSQNGLSATVYVSVDSQTGIRATLVISISDDGSHEIPDYTDGAPPPWSTYLDSIRSVYIEEGVTAIGANAFSAGEEVSLLTYAEIPSTVTRIGENAFYNQPSAEFSDGSDDGNLDLSHVTEMGEAAFYNCDEITSVTLNGQLNCSLEPTDPNYASIPDSAFASCGLTSYTLEGEFGIQRIGNSAFSGNRLNSVTFPDGLVTIGNSAFQGNPFGSMTSLTIPDSVETIGSSAFQSSNTTLNTLYLGTSANSKLETIGTSAFLGNTGLATVVIQSTALKEIGPNAFGSHEHNAYTAEATDDEGHSYTVGTQFQTPNDEVYGLLDDGVNCYLGERSPLQLVRTVLPSCESRGWREYTFEWRGSQTSETYFAYIDAVPHQYKYAYRTEPTCTQPAYDVSICTNLANGLVRECLTPESWEQVAGSTRLGHDYQLVSVSSNAVDSETSAMFTFQCQHYSAAPDENRHDGNAENPWQLSATVPNVELTATTTQNLREIADQLPSANTYTLSWNENEDTLNADLEAGERSYRYTLTPNSTRVPETPISEWDSQPLTIKVNVERTVLDFSNVYFGGTQVYVDSENPSLRPITVSGVPEEVNGRNTGVEYTVRYTSEYPDYDDENPPERDETWNGTVTVTFTYDARKFQVEENSGPAGYTFSVTENGDQGTVTISHPYIITERDIRLTANPIRGLEYDGTAQNTLNLDGVPEGALIEISWKDDQGNFGTLESIINNSGGNSIPVAPFTDAGVYTLDIKVSKTDFASEHLQDVKVSIGKQQVIAPTASPYTYDQTEKTGFTVPDDASYSIVESTSEQNTQTNAGIYEVKFELPNTDNYTWQGDVDSDGDGVISCSWTIRPKSVPNLYPLREGLSYVYNRASHTVVEYNRQEQGLKPEYDPATGDLTVTWNKEEVFTVTDARHTTVGKYTCTGTLAKSGNFRWENVSDSTVTLGSWSITKAQITSLPTLTAPRATYDGDSYDETITIGSYPEGMEGILEPNGYLYYDSATAQEALPEAPTNARTAPYYVAVNWSYDEQNYSIPVNPRTPFYIDRQELTASEVAGYSLTFSGEAQTVKAFTVSGLVGDDNESAYKITYTVKVWDAETEDWSEESTTYPENEVPTVTNVGKYQISAALRAQNYTATFIPYEVTVTPANSQSITLTPAQGYKGTWVSETSSYTVMYGKEPSFTIEGAAALDNADISYSLKEGSATDIIGVDSETGTVTIQKPGNATVVVTAAATNNVAGMSVEYIVYVQPADPGLTVNEDLLNGKFSYTGVALEKQDIANTGAVDFTGLGEEYEQPDNSEWEVAFYTYNEATAENDKTALENGTSGLSTVDATDVGDYWMLVTYPEDEYFNLDRVAVKVTIGPAQLTTSVTDYTGIYNGAAHDLADWVKENIEIKFGDKELSAEDFTISFSDAEKGTYSDTLFVTDATDGEVTYWYKVTDKDGTYAETTDSFTVTISPATLTLSSTLPSKEQLTRPYDGTVELPTGQAPTDTSRGLLTDDGKIAVTAAYADKNAAVSKDVVVTYTITFENGKAGNYTVVGNLTKDESNSTENEWVYTETKTGVGRITPKAVTVTVPDQIMTYSGGTTFTVGAGGIPCTVTTGGVDPGESLNASIAAGKTGTAASKDVNATNNQITFAADAVGLAAGNGETNAANYQVVGPVTAGLTIEAKEITLRFPEAEDGVINTSYTAEPVDSEVYAAEIFGMVGSDTSPSADDIAYTFYTNAECTAVYGTDGKTAPSAVGEYWVKAEVNGNSAVNANYTSAEATAKLVISTDSQVALKVTPDAYCGTYGGGSHAAANSVTVQAGEAVLAAGTDYTIYYTTTDPGDAKRLNPSAYENNTTMPSFTNAGTYTVYYLVDAKNYNDVADSFQVQIDRAELEITSQVALEKPYDGNNTAAVTSLMGTAVTAGNPATATVNGENGEAFTVTASAAYRSGNINDASPITVTYELSPNGDTAKLSNYTVRINGSEAGGAKETMKETLTDGVAIIPRPITVTILDDGKVYDGQLPTVSSEQDVGWEIAEGTVVAGEDLRITLTIGDPKAPKADVDTYAISGDWKNTNYNVTFAGESGGTTGTYTILPRPVNVTIGNTSGVYGDDHGAAVDSSSTLLTAEEPNVEQDRGLAPGESLEDIGGILLDTDANAESGVSSYSIYAVTASGEKITGETQYGNYMVTFVNGNATFTVNPRPITITIADKESAYGCTRQDLTWEDSYTNDSSKNGIVNGDNLGIVLHTEASSTSDVGTYPITGTATAGSDVTGNYAITRAGSWNGEDDNKGIAGTYTIHEATLTIEFSNETVNVSIGNPVHNPLKFINASNNNQELSVQPDNVTVQYKSSDEKVATVNGTTGAVTIVGTGDAIITATVTSGGQNFTGGDTASYELRVATASAGIQMQAIPNTDLTYNGTMQQLLSDYTVSPSNATVTFAVEAQTVGDRCEIASDGIPVAQDAGTYRVSWTAELAGYTEISGWVDVTIAKADPSTGFTSQTVQTEYEEGKVFDSTKETTLNKATDYTGSITYLSNNTVVASVTGNNLAQIALHSTGNAAISARFEETDNYNAQTVSFTLQVVEAGTRIQYSAADYEVTYDGQPYGADITVTSPSTYTIRYSDDNGASYKLEESPEITNVGTQVIYYQITSPGYPSATGTQTVTVEAKEITEDMISNVGGNYTYTGEQIRPVPIVRYGDILLTSGEDYEVSYGTNLDVGNGTVTITGKGNYAGSVIKTFVISPADANYLTAQLDRYYGTYGDGNTNHAAVTVSFGGKTLTVGQDYTISCETAAVSDSTVTFTEVGSHQITITGKGNYAGGEARLTYTLMPAASSDGLQLTVGGQGTPYITTYGEPVDGSIVIRNPDGSGQPLDQQYYSLNYVYYDNLGNQPTQPATYTESVLENGTPAAGMYVVTAEASAPYEGTGTFIFLIQQRSLAEATLKVVDDDLVYNQQAQKPDVTVTVTGSPTVGTDYTVNYYNNVNATVDGELAQVLITATGNNFTGSKTATFNIQQKDINSCSIDDIPDQPYTGQAVTPALRITDGAYSLVLGHDYTASCEDVGPGEATVTVTGIGNYQGTTTKTFTITSEPDPQPTEQFTLTVTPDTAWTYGSAPDSLALEVKFGDNELTNYGGQYTLLVDGTSYSTYAEALAAVKALQPGTHTVTAQGAGAYEASSSEVTITIAKILPEVSVVASPVSLSGSGTVTLTLSGSNLPAGTDLTALLRVDTANGTTLDLTQLTWTQAGSEWTASFNAANANETYTFTLEVAGSDYYEAASDTATVVTARRTSGGGGGGDIGGGTTTTYTISAEAGTGGTINPNGDVQVTRGADYTFTISASEGYAIDDVIVDGDSVGAVSRYTFENVREDHTIEAVFVRDNGVADPDETGVSNWLNTVDHFAYLSGYPGDLFGPDNNMTRAEAAQMFYNLLLNKDVPTTVTFVDVDSSTWYADAVHALASLSIINGVGDNRYEPERAITRAEFTVMATRFAHVQTAGVDTFSDVNESDWFFPYVATCVQYGWIDGYPDGTFRPDNSITRSEVTTIVNRMLGRSADSEYVDDHTEDLTQFDDVEPMHWAYYQIMEASNAHDYIKSGGMEDWTGLN